MTNAFDRLGVHASATEQEVRAAYRALVKRCHPDNFTDASRQADAQAEMIAINLAYEEALETAQRRAGDSSLVKLEYAKSFAERLVKQSMPEGALRQLHRAADRDGEWYALEGRIYMSLRRYKDAHDSYRAAVRLEPENQKFRSGALDAALAMKRQATLVGRMADRLSGLRARGRG